MSPPHGAPQHPLPRTSYLTASAPQRSGTVTPTSGSQTITSTPSPEPELVLRLRGAHEPATRRRRGIQWAEDVIDNEGLGRKKSKVCCIYHKERPVGESDSESGDSSLSSSDESASGEDTGEARMVGAGRRKGTRRKHAHDHDHDHDGDCAHGDEDGKGTGTAKGKRKASPNAYEKMPKYNVKKLHVGVVAGTKN